MKLDKKGFTLIEILAVIVILGILFGVAVIGVSKYIEKSRRNTYISSAKEYISIAGNLITNREISVRNSDTVYYIHINNLPTEKDDLSSPFGEWVDAYVVVTIDENNDFHYYWTSVDMAGYRVDLTEEEELDISDIYVSDNKTIDTNHLFDGKDKFVIYDASGNRKTIGVDGSEITDKNVTITYNVNGGSGIVSSTTCKSNVSCSITSVKPTRGGYTFKGWNTKADGSGTNYSSSGSITLTNDLVLYAQWESVTIPDVTITYNVNGGSGIVSSTTCKSNTSCSITNVKPTRGGYTFKGWNTKADGSGTNYSSGSSITISGNLTLYAKWEKSITYVTLTYYDGKGNSVKQQCVAGVPCATPCADTLFTPPTGQCFIGWYYPNTLLGTKYSGSITLDSDFSLYARWSSTANCVC